jgi:hypothetical protein
MGYTTTFSCLEQIDFHSKSALQKASLKSCALQTALGILIKVRRQRLQMNSTIDEALRNKGKNSRYLSPQCQIISSSKQLDRERYFPRAPFPEHFQYVSHRRFPD